MICLNPSHAACLLTQLICSASQPEWAWVKLFKCWLQQVLLLLSKHVSNVASDMRSVLFFGTFHLQEYDVTGTTSSSFSVVTGCLNMGSSLSLIHKSAWRRADTWVHEADLLQRRNQCDCMYALFLIIFVVLHIHAVPNILTLQHIHQFLLVHVGRYKAAL